jgi:AhpD family alkylhydroperoxidase
MPAEPQRMDLSKITPDAYRHFLQLEGLLGHHVDRKLLHLIKVRASQINGCAFCIAMHTDEALRDGERPERLTLLDAWEESTVYSEQERALLAWVEELTLIAESGASKESFDALKSHFSEQEIGWLTMAVVQINAWNRIAISSRNQYDRSMFAAAAPAEKVPQPA